jgi:hypothetical protein
MAEESKEIRITNVPQQVRKDLKNIAKNLGVDLGQFLKIKLKDISDSYSKEMKEPKR